MAPRRPSTPTLVPLQEYIQPQGGGFFFVLPGVVVPDRYLGETPLA